MKPANKASEENDIITTVLNQCIVNHSLPLCLSPTQDRLVGPVVVGCSPLQRQAVRSPLFPRGLFFGSSHTSNS